MATFSVTVPDAQAPRIVADVAKLRGVDISAMTLAQKVAFLKSDLQSYWQDCMIQVEVADAGSTAAATAIAAKKADIIANLTVT
jgi:hypothetical protein